MMNIGSNRKKAELVHFDFRPRSCKRGRPSKDKTEQNGPKKN